MDFNSRVINFDYRFTDLEDEIILYIEKNREEIIQSKIVDLARLFFTVPNTITRLCHKLEYYGFLELKKALKQELESYDEAKVPQEILLFKNLELIDKAREKKVVQLLKDASKVNFFSVGSTAHATRIVVDNFDAVDYKFFFYAYEHELRHKIETANNELFFFVSLSGEIEPLLSLAVQARERGHIVITLTGLSNNFLARLADISLFCYAPKRIMNNVNITDKTPLLIIMDSLLQEYAE
ncbi:MurR/RpiR family transcriptional regulator [Listeria rocourtiae]|uniref:MurR/RpiR family transcriptional regulator n=1 Tax=Listeria rocourtiae TaxID=647910 RepID=UPI001625E3E9|nr:MurR/RpiR family transcriptional regulator [Listeria rocourtiae]MBC1435026.1 MurR/RpiR family transcriptional regulator [Listeria rocourtiae]